jgi:DNA (cytosine-5)-methyltransferase 1
MKHYGDITKISGYDVPVVDVICGGSPCQDLSVAGKRAGLAGERSGLFMEQMRIVREMREKDARDNGRTGWAVRPRYMVWENVPGAFSSKGGEDFAAVIEEIIKVAEPRANLRVCVPPNGWTKSGCYYAEDGSWSIAWRVHDAQFWGVPQRRKRISLVADFGGLSAPEILFERKGMSRDPEPGGAERQGTSGRTEGSIETAGKCLNGWDVQSKHVQPEDGIAEALWAGFDSLSSNSMKSANPNSGCRQTEVARTLDCFDPNPSKNQGGIAIVDCGGSGRNAEQ